MSVYTPDLSGIDGAYYVTTYQRTIYKHAQKIMFEVPVFQNARLEVIKLGVVNSTLVSGVDYAVYNDDIADDAISVCKNINNSFSGVLLKSLTILAYVDSDFRIQVKFNQLYSDSITFARINQSNQLEVTPDLISNMVEQLAYLQQLIVDNAGSYSPQSNIIKLALNEFPNGDNDDNLIVDERHDINTLSGSHLIRPIYGSFFRDSVVVKNTLSGETFHEGLDYTVLDLDISRTKCTSNESGVYRIVDVIKSTVGELKVSYRAYGGVADIASMRMVQDRVDVIEQYLSKTSYVTPKTLPADPTIISIRDKIQEMEGTVRLLLQNGLPSYGDVSTNTAVLKKIVAQDSVLHWWSIGTLYRVAGSVDDILSDVFKFRLKSMISSMMFECDVAVNVNNTSNSRLDVTCNNSNIPDDTLYKYSPKLRIIEVSAGGVYSGVVLQLGMKLSPGLLQETFDIEDMSGRESCWKLIPFSASSTPPEDTGVLMPNGVSIFSYGDPTALVDEAAIPFISGLNLLMGVTNLPLDIGTMIVPGIANNFDMVIQDIGNIKLDNAKAFELKVVSHIGTGLERTLKFTIPITSKNSQDKAWFGSVSTSTTDGTYVFNVSLKYDNINHAYALSYYT